MSIAKSANDARLVALLSGAESEADGRSEGSCCHMGRRTTPSCARHGVGNLCDMCEHVWLDARAQSRLLGANPLVYLELSCVSKECTGEKQKGEPPLLPPIVIELWSHLVPKTAEVTPFISKSGVSSTFCLKMWRLLHILSQNVATPPHFVSKSGVTLRITL